MESSLDAENIEGQFKVTGSRSMSQHHSMDIKLGRRIQNLILKMLKVSSNLYGSKPFLGLYPQTGEPQKPRTASYGERYNSAGLHGFMN